MSTKRRRAVRRSRLMNSRSGSRKSGAMSLGLSRSTRTRISLSSAVTPCSAPVCSLALRRRPDAGSGCRLCSSTHSFRAFANLVRSLRPREFDFRQVVRMGSRQAAQKHFRNQQHRHLSQAVATTRRGSLDRGAPALRPPDPARKHARDGRRDGRRVRPVDPGGSAHWPVRPAGMVQWRHVGVRDGSSARGRWRGCLLPLPDRCMAPAHHEGLGWLRSKLANLSYRWGLILMDWGNMRAGRKSFSDFIADRAIARRFYRGRQRGEVTPNPPMQRRKLMTTGCSITQMPC